MKLPALLISDLHLVDSPSTEYRWDLFPWLVEQCKAEKVKTLLILGDLTDAKDNHSAKLVNRIVMAINSLPVERVVILAGNHDWLLKGHEFFRFLSVLPHVEYISKPTEDDEHAGPLAYFLPYSKSPAEDWKGMDFSHYDYLFMHQTVKGAKSSNGQLMEGEDLPALNAIKVYSGDIHVPQVIGGVEYVGSPYHVHMGDAFKPRCVLLERDGNPVNLYFHTISRVTVSVFSLKELCDLSLRTGDQIKLRIHLDESEVHEWAAIRRKAQEWLVGEQVVIHGIELVTSKSDRRMSAQAVSKRFTPMDAVRRFVEADELGAEALDIAAEILQA